MQSLVRLTSGDNIYTCQQMMSPGPKFFFAIYVLLLRCLPEGPLPRCPAAISVKTLLLSGSGDEIFMHGPLISKVVVCLARSRILVSFQRGWQHLEQACSMIADFSHISCLAASCSCRCVSSTLFISNSPVYLTTIAEACKPPQMSSVQYINEVGELECMHGSLV